MLLELCALRCWDTRRSCVARLKPFPRTPLHLAGVVCDHLRVGCGVRCRIQRVHGVAIRIPCTPLIGHQWCGYCQLLMGKHGVDYVAACPNYGGPGEPVNVLEIGGTSSLELHALFAALSLCGDTSMGLMGLIVRG